MESSRRESEGGKDVILKATELKITDSETCRKRYHSPVVIFLTHDTYHKAYTGHLYYNKLQIVKKSCLFGVICIYSAKTSRAIVEMCA